jgi:stress-induced morphogen
MTSKNKVTNAQTREVEQFLRGCGFADVECYQRKGYDYLLRVRVTDKRFQGMSRLERMGIVEKELEKLRDDLQASITMLVVVTPDERKTSLLSLEFDDPSRVML